MFSKLSIFIFYSNTGKTYLRLKANIFYKQGDFQKAAEVYSKLLTDITQN
ncbi:MAG: tetratricopeptide repeat protein [Leptospiraceae bacterium]|nr:tetratricopeptide repeat protein [Leptospiraceae bacterium]